jgi:hypothetical protein
VPRRVPYVPTHRSERPSRRSSQPSPASLPTRPSLLRRTLTVGGVAAAATGVAVCSGIAMPGALTGDPAAASLVSVTGDVRPPAATPRQASLDAALADRTRAVSRSADRAAVDPVKQRALDQTSGGQVSHTADLTPSDPRDIARAMLGRFGFGADQFSCLDSIYSQESGWNVHADNPSSSAYGIPQALPGSKMASAGADWANNPATQIRWGLGYIKGRYGTPCNAWGFKQSHGWY